MTAGPGTAPGERVRGPVRPRMRAGADAALRERFPQRAVPDRWETTGQDRDTVMSRLLRAPFTAGTTSSSVNRRRRGLARFLDWLSQYPGDTWQQRWLASGVAGDGRLDWRPQAAGWLTATGRESPQTAGVETSVTSGLGQLIYADVLRPDMEWLLASPIRFPLGGEMPRVRDPAGFAALEERAVAAGIGFFSRAARSSRSRSSSRPRAVPSRTSLSATAWSSSRSATGWPAPWTAARAPASTSCCTPLESSRQGRLPRCGCSTRASRASCQMPS